MMIRRNYDLTTPDGRLANMLAFHDENRQHAARSGYHYEVRVWEELPEPHWAAYVFTRDRTSANMIKQAFRRAYGWRCEVWSCSPVTDPDIPPISLDPVAWHCTDR